MPGKEFVSCWLKISRAEEHFNTLKSEIASWAKSGAYSIVRQCDSEGRRYSLVLNMKGQQPFDKWSLIASDCVQNLRGALDHSVYALAIQNSGGSPPPNASKLQFPICDSLAAFDLEVKKKRISGLSSKAQAFIEQAQPYNRWHPELPPILSVLRDFSDSDKHRLLNVAASHIVKRDINFVTPVLVPITIHWLKTQITDGAEICFFELPTSQPDVEYSFHVTIHVTIAHLPGPTGRHVSWLVDVLTALVDDVKRIVNGVV